MSYVEEIYSHRSCLDQNIEIVIRRQDKREPVKISDLVKVLKRVTDNISTTNDIFIEGE